MANRRPIDDEDRPALRPRSPVANGTASPTRPRPFDGATALLALVAVGIVAVPLGVATTPDDGSPSAGREEGNVTAIGRCSPANVTVTDVLKLASLIRDRIYCHNNATDNDGVRYHPLIAGAVRLAFHSSVDRRLRGCINLDDPRHSTLRLTVDELEQLYQQTLADPYYVQVSRADFWALAGIVAVEVATSGALSVEFRYGRCDDCASGSYNTSALIDLPDMAHTGNSAIAYLRRVFKLNFTQAVALMGAHSLGFVTDNGAIVDKWTPNPELLSSGFFASMMSRGLGWHQKAHHYSFLNRTVWSWTHADGKRIYLNADMGLFKAVGVADDDATGKSDCSWSQCPEARTSAIVAFYARDQRGFFFYFASAFRAMLESGLSGLRLPAASAIPAAA